MMSKLDLSISESDMRAAIKRRDPNYDGRFVYAVITTGVYCRPVCAARPARPENLRFYKSPGDASKAGFRACKRCRPDDPARNADHLATIAKFIETHADEKLTLANLANRFGVSPSHFQRRFKEAFGVSPKAYQDAVRMKVLKRQLKSGDAIAGSIFEAGYGSTSRVYGEAARNVGMTPSAYRAGGKGETIAHAYRKTAFGPLLMAATQKGVCFAMFGKNKSQLLECLRAEFPNASLVPSPKTSDGPLNDWIDALERHLANGGPHPDLPLDLRGTAFQIKVWRFLLSIRDGDVVSYSDVAQGIGNPKAVRAAASACASNRVGVLVPCHRVLRGDGGVGGYRWGIERKRALLDLERRARAEP